jgi:hypothetical protein
MIFDNPGWKVGQGGDVSRWQQTRVTHLVEHAEARSVAAMRNLITCLARRGKRRDAIRGVVLYNYVEHFALLRFTKPGFTGIV